MEMTTKKTAFRFTLCGQHCTIARCRPTVMLNNNNDNYNYNNNNNDNKHNDNNIKNDINYKL
jgi:hypothetical protein